MRKYLDKFILWLNDITGKYIMEHIYIPKHADKEFWGDDFK